MEKTTGAVNLLNLTAQTGLNNLPNIGKTGQSTSEVSFLETFTKTSEVKTSNSVGNELATKKIVVETGTAGSNKNIKTAEDVETKSKESLDENKMKDIAKEVSKAADEIKDKIKDELSVTDEDIESAMEVLGLVTQNLFNANDLRSLMMELTGTTDSIELLTNVDLYDGIKEVTVFAENLVNEVSEELNVSVDELTEIISTDSFEKILGEMNVMPKAEVDGNEENEVIKNITEDSNDVSEKTDLPKADEKETFEKVVNIEIKENVVNPKETSNEEISDELVKAITEDTAKVVTAVKDESDEIKPIEVEVNVENTVSNSQEIKTEAETTDGGQMNQQTENKNKNSFENNKNQEINISTTQTVTTQTVNTVGDIVETVTSYSTYADAENIMRQVTDHVKINISGDVTKMEMQLHPASLGTVNMQINSQNGQITAHLTVQNELVKSVLESQMVKLQETFNEQGTKVNAIEVTVAGQNLDAKSDNNYSQERENSQGGSKKRNINLNEISSFDELTDEEVLEAKVMEMNGSSVNYTA